MILSVTDPCLNPCPSLCIRGLPSASKNSGFPPPEREGPRCRPGRGRARAPPRAPWVVGEVDGEGPHHDADRPAPPFWGDRRGNLEGVAPVHEVGHVFLVHHPAGGRPPQFVSLR